MRPEIKVPVPGPKARELVLRDTNSIATTTKTAPVAAAHASGVWVTDVDGNRFLDFTSGVGVVNTGYANPRVVKAVREQAEKLIHFAGTDFYYDTQVALAERLAKLTPGAFPKRVFYTNSGTESVEAAVKLARWKTKRPQFLGFLGAFHGRTMGSLAFNASKRVHRERYFPMMPGVVHVPYPNPYRNPWGIDGYAHPEDLAHAAIDYIERFVFDALLPPSELAMILVEAVQGEGGYIVPPKQFLPMLERLARDHGALLAIDEVQSGFGRTGKMFASEHFGIEPDAMCLAKGIASGLPMGAMVFRADLDWDVSGAHSNTYGGNALACAAGLATLDALTVDGLVANAAKQGAYLRTRLDEIAAKDPRIGDVRGLGLMLATEFVRPGSREPDPATRNEVAEEAFKRGLILLPCGKSGIRYIPPLSISEQEIDAGVEVLREALKAAA